MKREPPWYTNAVVYELLVRAFHDSNGDGVGELELLDEPDLKRSALR